MASILSAKTFREDGIETKYSWVYKSPFSQLIAGDRGYSLFSINNLEKILTTRDYLINNWDAIQTTLNATDGSGCSAEGNVSHILSARLSQKGMGWCEHNADVIGKLRGIQANDEEKAFTELLKHIIINEHTIVKIQK